MFGHLGKEKEVGAVTLIQDWVPFIAGDYQRKQQGAL